MGTPSQLIEALVIHWACWDKYEKFLSDEVGPRLVANPESGDETEKIILQELHLQLNESEWKSLPQLITEKRREILREIESAKLKREVQERERQESERQCRKVAEEAKRERKEAEVRKAEEAERERIRQDHLRKEIEARKRELLTGIDQKLQQDFLMAEEFFRSQESGLVSDKEFEFRKLDFVRKWFTDRAAKSANNQSIILDDEQLAAIAAVNGHVQVVARAGSGKTATLVNRALFLMEHCKIAPSSLLLLAFNRKAAAEIRRRLLAHLHSNAENLVQNAIGQRCAKAQRRQYRFDINEAEMESVSAVASELQIELPYVMTFHALAYAVVHPEETILYNDTNGQNQTLNRVFQSVIDDHLRQSTYQTQIRKLMLAHFKEDWDRIVAGWHDLPQEEFLQLRRSLPRESLAGEYVKSWGEKLIADFLFEHDISYKYERNHWWNGVNYRPDFTIFKTKKSGVIIEYFGLMGDSDYDKMSEQKRRYWTEKSNWKLLEFQPHDVQDKAGFWAQLQTSLQQHKITCRRLSEDEIWLRVRDRAIDRFTKAMVGFVGRCRKLSLTPNILQERIDAHNALSSVEDMFLCLGSKLYAAYLDRLAETGEDDFDGLMQRAATAIESGVTMFQRKTGGGDLAALKFVFIDEFQDFSYLFYRLLQAIRQVNPAVRLFCVGDDWQAINGFAGSDLRFFKQFQEFIGESRQLYISTNYRSVRSVVDVGNALMSGIGKPAVAYPDAKVGEVILADTSKFEPSEIEKRNHSGDIITPMIFRLIKQSLQAEHGIVLLARMNTLPWYINFINSGNKRGLDDYLALIRSLFPPSLGERIIISTAHGYKGLQKPTVIVLDAVASRFPFVHPDWVFSRVLGDSVEKIVQEERRLFYVALTRAIDKLIIVTDSKNQSPFLNAIQSSMPLTPIDWNAYPAGPAWGRPESLIVKVTNAHGFRKAGGTYSIKEQLKACGYRFQNAGQACWTKSWLTEGFKLTVIQHEVWAQEADGLAVYIYTEDEQQVGEFRVNQGIWQEIQNNLEDIFAIPNGSADDAA
ncbi:MAG: UvrD-helicase domain-containing protein [Azoarcus sp.]|jgi:DNA helicase-4|nr:UvrD-helicase domain-containing protein [Azoarcus sp.]